MATYEIKKEIRDNGDMFLCMYFMNNHLVSRYITPNNKDEEEKEIEYLKKCIETHKKFQSGELNQKETIYKED